MRNRGVMGGRRGMGGWRRGIFTGRFRFCVSTFPVVIHHPITPLAAAGVLVGALLAFIPGLGPAKYLVGSPVLKGGDLC